MRYFRRSMRITVAAAGGPIAAAQRWSVRWGSVPRIVSVLRAPYRARVHSEKPNSERRSSTVSTRIKMRGLLE